MKTLYSDIDAQLLAASTGSTDYQNNLFELCDSIGPRLAGTRGYRRAAEFMRDRFEQYALDDARLEPLEFTAWHRAAAATLVMSQPYDRTFDCLAQVYSASTGADGIEVSVVDIEHGSAELVEANRGKLTGQFALVIGGSRHRMDIYEDCVAAGAAGLLLACPVPGMGLRAGSLSNGVEGAIPAVSIGNEVGLMMQRQVRTGPVRARLFSQSHCEPDTTWNVVADLVGTERPDELLIVGGHLDSHDVGPCAYDNGAGAMTVLEIARLLARQRQHLKRTVRFIGFAGEEIGLLGSTAYVATHRDELANHARLMVNCDMPPLNPPFGLGLLRSAHLESFATRLAEEMSTTFEIRQVTHCHSDFYPFTEIGTPAIAVAGFGTGKQTQKFPHMAGDTPEKLPIEPLVEGAAFGARLLMRAANDDALLAATSASSQAQA